MAPAPVVSPVKIGEIAAETGPPPVTTGRPVPAEDRADGSEAQPPNSSDWKYDPKIWAWATLSAMREKATESGVAPESVALTPKDVRTAMADQLGLTPSQRDFIGGVGQEREYMTRCTTMRILLAHCDLIAWRDSSWALTQSGAAITESQFHELIDSRLESFGPGEGPSQAHRRYRGHPGFPDGTTVASRNALPSAPSAPSRLGRDSSSPAKRWAYDRRVWGAATLIAIRNVINRGVEQYAPNSEVAYEMERVLHLSPRATQIVSRLNPAEPEYKARCHTMRLHLWVAGFVEKRSGESGWRLTEAGVSADADDVVAGLDRVAQFSRADILQWNASRPIRGSVVGDTSAFLSSGNSALADDGLVPWAELRTHLGSLVELSADPDSGQANTQSQPEVELASAADLPGDAGVAVTNPAISSSADRDSRADEEATRETNVDRSATDATLGAIENDESDDADASKWAAYATDQGLAPESVPYIASITMGVVHEAANHAYEPTAQMINDRVLAHLRETGIAGDRDDLHWSQGSAWWWRFHLARMCLWQGAEAVHPADSEAIGLYDTTAGFAIAEDIGSREPDNVLQAVQRFLGKRELIDWKYDYRAWTWEVLLMFRACAIDESSQRQVATLADLTRALSEALPAIAESVEDEEIVMSALDRRRPEYVVRTHAAVRYLEYLGLCTEMPRRGSHVAWALTEKGDEIKRDEFDDQLGVLADVTRDDLVALGFGGGVLQAQYPGTSDLGNVDSLRKSKRWSDLELCAQVVRELKEAGRGGVEQGALWNAVGQEVGVERPLAKRPDLVPWRSNTGKGNKPVQNLLAYRLMHVMRALSIGPSPTIEKADVGGKLGWRLAEGTGTPDVEDQDDAADFGPFAAMYFQRHDYSTWRTKPWMTEFCNTLNDIADGDGSLFEELTARLLEAAGGGAVEAHLSQKNTALDHMGIDIVAKSRSRQKVGQMGDVSIYAYDGVEEVMVLQCKHLRGEVSRDQARKVYDAAGEWDRRATGNFRVTTAILVTLGDLNEEANESLWWTPAAEAGSDEKDQDDGPRVEVWDGGRVLRLVEQYKVGVKEMDADGTNELEVDVEYLEQLARKAGIKVGTNEVNAGDSSDANGI